MKTICPPGYHHNGFVATHATGHVMYGSGRANCFHECMYTMPILLL